MIEEEAEVGLVCSLILEDISARFWIDFEAIWGPKVVHSEVGHRVGKVIGKGRAKDGLIGANLGSKMGSCWAENRSRLESKSSIEKRRKKRG